MATVTHSEPYSNGPVAFVGHSLVAGWPCLLCCFCLPPGSFLLTVAHLEPCAIFLGSVCIHFGIIFEFGIISGSFGDHFGISLGPFCDHCLHLAFPWDHFGISLGSFVVILGSFWLWCHFVVIWRSLWDHFGIILTFGDHFGIIRESFLHHFGI